MILRILAAFLAFSAAVVAQAIPSADKDGVVQVPRDHRQRKICLRRGARGGESEARNTLRRIRWIVSATRCKSQAIRFRW